MSGADIFKALLGRGYFPKELPPAFTTEDFGREGEAVLNEWESARLFKKVPKKLSGKKFKSKSYGYDLANAEIETISTPKKGYERRGVHITHPLPQALLVHEVATNWPSIQKWLSRQTYSLDEIRVSSKYTRSIKGINFALHRAKKSYIEASADWLVKTDITRFYPSIYTHSIPWAAYGKERVKSELKKYQGSLADRLDMLVRACNRNQTVGIPVGPETSRIFAEIISSRIDSDFASLSDGIPTEAIDRLQDDWFLGLKTLESAETALSAIVRTYRAYGLDINGSKTSVARVVAHAEEAWISELGSFLSHRSGPLGGTRLREFLTLALRLQTTHEKGAVTNYALTVLENHNTSKDDVEVLESFLLKAAIISPGSMARICELLINIEYHTKRLSKQRIGPRFTELAERNLTNGNLYEVIWQLYALRGLGIRLESRTISEMAESTSSSALALVLLDLDERGLCVRKLPKSHWEAAITKDRVRSDWIWLLAYEGFRHGWLSDTKRIMSDGFFAPLAKRDIVFYDPKRNVRRTSQTARLRARLRKKSFEEITKFFLDVRGVNVFDGDY